MKKKLTEPPDVMVTNVWGRIGYNIVRSLGKQGLKVAVGMDKYRGMALLSRYKHTTFFHHNFITHPKEFIRDFEETIQKYRPKAYIPSDQEVMLVAKYLEKSNIPGIEIPIASFTTLRSLHKKDDVYKIACSQGISTPETLVPKNETDIFNFAQEFGDPIVLKRISSSGARGVYYLQQDSIRQFLDVESKSSGIDFGKFLVQRYVKGTGYGVSMLFNQGQPRARFTHKRLREKTYTGGISTLRISTENREIEDAAEQILTHVKYHGVAMVEFKYDEKKKKGWLIEVNPRFWGSIGLAIQSGVDFPYLLYRMAVDGDVPPVMEYVNGVKVRWIMGDLQGIAEQLKNLHKISSNQAEKSTATGFDDFYWDDPLPFLGEIYFSVIKRIKTRKHRIEEIEFSVD